MVEDWIKIMYSDKGKATDWKPHELFELFQIFCIEKQIHKPQDESLRQQILYMTEEVFKKAEKLQESQ